MTMHHGLATKNLASRLLEGSWVNQLGSELYLEADPEGAIRGTFSNHAGWGLHEACAVYGVCDPSSSGLDTVLGFVVLWPAAHTQTAWSGQYHADDDTIRATWLMTTETEPEDEWRATIVGQDIFTRARPTNS